MIIANILWQASKRNKLLATLSFDDKELIHLCNSLADKDADLKVIIESYGYPPYWKRALHVETLVQIILEQQVSLASAKAAFLQLKKKIGKFTPEKLLALSDEDFRAAYFSKQKTSYTRNLATAVVTGEINLCLLANESDDIIRTKLTKIKGIGNWTADVFLMMVLSRKNVFPFGDIALVNSLKHIKKLPKETSREEMEWIVEQWAPYKTIAAFMLWWAYIQRKNIKL